MATAGSIVIDLLMRTGSFETDTKRAEARLKSMEKTVDQWSRRIALGATAAGAAFATWTVAMTKSMDSTLKMAKQIGTTTEALTGLRYAAQQFANVSDQTFDMSLRRMTRRIAEAADGSGAAKDALKGLGLSARELAGLPVEEQFMRIADAMQRTRSQGDRLRGTMAIFDTEGMPLVDALAQGSGELEKYVKQAERFGVVISTEAAQAAAQFQTNLDQLNSMAKGVSITFANELLPELADFSGRILQFAELTKKAWEEVESLEDKTRDLAEFSGLNTWLNDLGRQLATTMDEVSGLKLLFDGMVSSWNLTMASFGFGDYNEALEAVKRHQADRAAFNPRANRERWNMVENTIRVESDPVALVDLTNMGGGGGSGKKGKLDAGEQYLKQLQERVALLGKETEHEQLLARIASGSLTFRTEKQREVAEQLAKQLDATQKQIEMEEILRDLRQQQSITQMQLFRDLAAFGQGDRVRELNADLARVEDRYRSIIDTRRNSPLGLSDDELALIRESMQVELDMVREFHDQKLALQQDWSLGAIDALKNYADEAANVYDSVGRLATTAFKGMEDSLVNFVRTGKFEFADFADSIISDMIRIMVQQQITGPLAGAFSGMLAGAFGAAVAPAGVTPGLDWTFASGGYTGDGGKYEPAGIVHRGEGVLNQEEIKALGGPGGFEAFRRALKSRHAVGGMAGSPALPPAMGGAGAVEVNIINQSGQPVSTGQPQVRMDDVGRMVIDVMLTDLRRNGPYTQQLKKVIA